MEINKLGCYFYGIPKTGKAFLIVPVVLFAFSILTAQTISSVDYTTQGATILVTYNLSGCHAGERQDIQLHFEDRNGQKIIPVTLQGDYHQVPCGVGKRIVWQVKQDREELQGEYRAVLTIAPRFNTVQIGTQIWMAENLSVDSFSTGGIIIHALSQEDWIKANTNHKPAWCYYDNETTNGNKFGRLYNWYAVNDNRGLCPFGWHIPSSSEWNTLIDYLGGTEVSGGGLKSNSSWLSPNTGANNNSGFSAMPAGLRLPTGDFGNIGRIGHFWTSTADTSSINTALSQYLHHANSVIREANSNYWNGLSVRCLKD